MHQKVDTRIRLALIYGSSREGRFCDKVAGWAISQIAGDGPFDLAVVDPGEIDLPPRHVSGKHPALEELRSIIGWADGFVVVTPEYNRGYPAILKFLIDAVGPEWRGKPVGFVSYGGISGGLRAVEQLRLVFGELHAAPIRDGVAFADVWSRFDAEGALLNADRAEQAMATMLAQLHWWASALRKARAEVPYGQFAAA
ncbi:NADPH-dependent FMN reductase [Bosea sp. UC22_33]|uniref:NADPH-dependent FMN reductase n=1 Tax=Bosea sp. UC22_33 TaxID=3350165 RepID=UPI003670BFEC